MYILQSFKKGKSHDYVHAVIGCFSILNCVCFCVFCIHVLSCFFFSRLIEKDGCMTVRLTNAK